jgi:hypothetical protein
VFAPIELELEVDGCSARLNVPGVIDARGEPIKNPLAGKNIMPRSTFLKSMNVTFVTATMATGA